MENEFEDWVSNKKEESEEFMTKEFKQALYGNIRSFYCDRYMPRWTRYDRRRVRE